MKRCPGCGETKPLSDYYRDKARPDGHYPRCKACHCKTTKAGYYKNLEARKKKHRENYRKNREVRLAYFEKYREENRELVRARNRDWARRNKDRVAANTAAYIARNPDGPAERQRRRRTRKKSQFVAPVTIDDLIVHTGNLCGICGDPIEEVPHIDHIIPLAAGGTHEPSNCQLAHPTCNKRKGARVDYVPEAA